MLSYNSQMWRQDSGGAWKLGKDVGYGLGWSLQAGSIVPVLLSGAVQYFVFTDATGAEYRLYPVGNGVFASLEGVHVWYDSAAQALRFPDGSWWDMYAQSAALEADAGTLYPTAMHDTNGNYIAIQYQAGAGAVSANTSARIMVISDGRSGPYTTGSAPTYQFGYTAGAAPHLVSIDTPLQTSESYRFTIATGQTVSAPFGSGTWSTAVLQSVVNYGVGTMHQLAYNGSGETDAGHDAAGRDAGVGVPELSVYGDGPELPGGDHAAIDDGVGRDAGELERDAAGRGDHAWLDDGERPGGEFEQGVDVRNERGVAGSGDELRGARAGQRRSDAYGLHVDNGRAGERVCGDDGEHAESRVEPGAKQEHADARYQRESHAIGSLRLREPEHAGEDVRLYVRGGHELHEPVHLQPGSAGDGDAGRRESGHPGDEYLRQLRDGLRRGRGDGVASGSALHDDTNYGTGFTYRGNVTQTVSVGGSAVMRYESTGVVVCSQDGAGHTTGSSPSADSNYSLPGVLTPGGNANLATTVAYISSWAVTSVTGPNGVNGTTTYDNVGRPQTTKIPDGAETDYTYAYAGLSGAVANQQTAMLGTGTTARWKRTTLDGFGRVTRVESGNGPATSAAVSQVDTQYAPCACSPLGKVSQVSMPYAPGGTAVWTRYTYDGSGRTLTVTAPDGSVTRTEYLTVYGSYTGNLVRVTDAALKWKIQQTDALGNLVRVIEPDPAGGADWITNYTYDALGHLTGVSMARSNGTQTRTFAYTGADLTSVTNPENGTVTYQYDASHHVTKRTDALGQETRYTYDGYGRLTEVQHWAVS